MSRRTIIFIILGLLLVGVFGRLLPHAPNATPIAAIALVASLYLPRQTVLIVPLVCLVVSDLFIGLYDAALMFSVYASFALIAALSLFAARFRSFIATAGYVVASPLIFFLITNAAVWWFSPWYSKDLAGLLYSYELGLPFLRNMFLGDVVYTTALLGAAVVISALAAAAPKWVESARAYGLRFR